MQTMKTRKARAGFTLVELIVVIAILAVLAAAAIAGYASITQQARESQARSDAATVCNAVNNHNSMLNDSSNALGAFGDITFSNDIADLSITKGGGTGAGEGAIDMQIIISLTAAQWTAAQDFIEINTTGTVPTWVVVDD